MGSSGPSQQVPAGRGDGGRGVEAGMLRKSDYIPQRSAGLELCTASHIVFTASKPNEVECKV